MKPEPTRASQGISFELPILRAAKERAASKRMSLSAYVNQLIFDDLNGQLASQDGNSPVALSENVNLSNKRTDMPPSSTDSS